MPQRPDEFLPDHDALSCRTRERNLVVADIAPA